MERRYLVALARNEKSNFGRYKLFYVRHSLLDNGYWWLCGSKSFRKT